MDNTIINYLEKLELSEFEVKLYLAILELGPKSVRELAHELEINRTTVYFYIDQLIEKELVMKVVKGLKTLIVLNDPRSSLEALVDKKAKSVKTIQKDLHDITDKIVEKYVPFRDIGDAEIRHYKGKLGVKKGIISEKWGNRARKSHSGRRKGAFLRVQLVGPKEQVF